MDPLSVIARAVPKMLAEVNRLLDAPELESGRQDDESPEAFVMRKALEASGLPDQLRGAVAALDEILRVIDGIERGEPFGTGDMAMSPLEYIGSLIRERGQ